MKLKYRFQYLVSPTYIISIDCFFIKGGHYMKYNKYLIITFLIFIILLTTFFYTKNIFYFYSTIPICIYVSFVRYFQEKNKLLIKTNKILNLLKYENIFYATAVIIAYLTPFVNFINKIKILEYYYVAYMTFVIFLLLYAIIYFKRTLLIRKELRNNNSKQQKRNQLTIELIS